MSDYNDESETKQPRGSKKDPSEILSVARKRMGTAESASSGTRTSQMDDLRFAAGSPDNMWQWPTEVQVTRAGQTGTGVDARPMLTINKLPQHIRQVTNDQRQNRPSGNVIPVDSGADVEVAEIFNGMVRHIEYESDADVAYDTACENQVTHGEGFIRIITQYVSEDSFEQEIRIKRIRNPFSVYMDPMIQDPCGADAKWALVTEDLTKEEFENQFPDATPISSMITMGIGNPEFGKWINEDTIRIAEYFCIEDTPGTLNLYADGATSFQGEPEDEVNRLMQGKPVKSRPSSRKKVWWYKINGYEILQEREWPGKYIPIVRVVGNEFEVDGEIYVSGIVRNAKDAQRMYNYHASAEAEQIALAPKAPYVGYAGQFEGFEDDWKTANSHNHPYLQVNPEVDGEGRVLPLPQRTQPPMVQSGIIAAKQGASEDIKETTGQYNASLGQPSNERSAKAILARQKEGDVSTYHYVDNLARAVRYVTRQIVDLIPKIYDTIRIARTLGEDGTSNTVEIDPGMPQPVTKVQDAAGNVIKKIYNPGVGKYDVMVITGPGYATKRQQALESMAQLLQGNPGLWQIAGDLFVKNMDWPGAAELAKRIAKTIDPKLMDKGDDDPALQQAQQQIQELMQQNQQMMAMMQNIEKSFEAREIAVKEGELEVKKVDAETKRFDAETKRIQATAAAMTPEQVQEIVMGTMHAAIENGDLFGRMPTPPAMEQTIPQAPQPPMPMGEPPAQPPQDPMMGQAQQPVQPVQEGM